MRTFYSTRSCYRYIWVFLCLPNWLGFETLLFLTVWEQEVWTPSFPAGALLNTIILLVMIIISPLTCRPCQVQRRERSLCTCVCPHTCCSHSKKDEATNKQHYKSASHHLAEIFNCQFSVSFFATCYHLEDVMALYENTQQSS